ncbi:MAG: hypothetical protein JOZ77_10670 [Candidatus Eremiobacteraeota bacterium]|nr:hypothetical protein [Candidatus Eremiobacteraeota bacterium]
MFTNFYATVRVAVAVAIASTVSACSSYAMSPLGQRAVDSPDRPLSESLASDVSVLKTLTKQVVIGSAVDPVNGAQNPYGLTVAPATAGALTAGDLVVCNFNAKSNVQGTGKSIVALHAVPNSTPIHLSATKSLLGCDAIALDGTDTMWASSMVGNDNPVLDATGKLIVNISGKPFDQPWGQVYAQPSSGSPAFYESNAGDGSIVRINLGSKFTYDVIATGFPVNHGKPGTALAPSGLAYDSSIDTLYFADGQNNTVVAFKNVSTIPKGGIKAVDGGMKFGGPSGDDAHILFAGSPLNGPISTALLPDGNLVVGNTLDPTGKNLLVELSVSGKVLDVRNVDKGASGALFGIVATGSSNANTKIYFNDDNDNNVQVLER